MFKSVLIAVTLAAISGCSVLPKIGLSSASKKSISVSSVDNDNIVGSLVSKGTDFKTMILANDPVQDNPDDLATLLSAFSVYKNDYELMRPSLLRLLALEEDLSFLLDILEQTSSIPSFESSEEIELSRRFTPDVDPAELETLRSVDGTFSKVYNMDFDKAATVEVGVAPKLIVENEKVTKQLSVDSVETLIDLKFSPQRNVANNSDRSSKPPTSSLTKFVNIDTASEFLNPRTPIIKGADMAIGSSQKFKTSNPLVTESKFSSIGNEKKALKNMRPISACGKPRGGNIAVHLASFLSKQRAQSAWDDFKKKAVGILCDENALIKEVEVNNKIFLSLRLGPYVDREQALEKCLQIKTLQSYCAISVYEGELL